MRTETSTPNWASGLDGLRRGLARTVSRLTGLPLLRWLDPVETVRVLHPDGALHAWRGGTRVGLAPTALPTRATAVMLPERLTLVQECSFPDLGEDDLAAAVALKAEALSPFPDDDRVHGWQATDLAAGERRVRIAIASRRHIAGYLATLSEGPAARPGTLAKDHSTLEVWADAHSPIVLRGFGESLRLQRQRRQRQALSALLALFIALGIAVAAGPLLRQHQSLLDARAQLAALRADTLAVVDEREQLLALQSTLTAIHAAWPTDIELSNLLMQLTDVLPDDAHLVRLEITGDLIRMAGFAMDAAGLIDHLGKHPMFASVRSPAPISRTREGLESFSLELMLTTGESDRDAAH